jgi:hypothetical protein
MCERAAVRSEVTHEEEYLEALLEDVNEKLDLVIEGHRSLQREIKDMHQEINEKFELVDLKPAATLTDATGLSKDALPIYVDLAVLHLRLKARNGSSELT